MKFIDRLTDDRVSELPNPFLTGRYCLLMPFIVNGHSQLKNGDIIADDGSGAIKIRDDVYQLLSFVHTDEQKADAELTSEAVVMIEGKLAYADFANVSPMMPAEMAAQCDLEDVERKLASILNSGHLHSISDRPRRDLRYDDMVAPVARARRLASSALNHLASHSDCWQQRTLNGIQPRKILARFSEDEYAIYENRLYKRLLDRLDRHLAKRVARIKSVNFRLEKALNFHDSENTDVRLRNEICGLWGQSYLDDKTGMQLEAGKEALATLQLQMRAIRGLKQRGLYLQVPSASTVPSQLHRTNILNDDPHYRHLPPLWEKLKDDREEHLLPPEVRLTRQLKFQHAYESYVGLVARRALARYNLLSIDGLYKFFWAGHEFELKQDSHDWVLRQRDGVSLKIVPIAWLGSTLIDSEILEPNTVVCWPGTTDSLEKPQQLPVSPLDLYVVEKMGRMIDKWLLQQLLKNYGRKLGPVPTQTMRLVQTWTEFQIIDSSHVRQISPLNKAKVIALKDSLPNNATLKITRDVIFGIDQVNEIAHLCGHTAKFQATVHKLTNHFNFDCKCEECERIWSLKTKGNKQHFSMRKKGSSKISEVNGFNWCGRDWVDFDIN